MGLLRLTTAALAASLFLCSCQPRIIEHLVVQRDTTYLTNYVRDSVYFRDSVYVKEVVKGDTVRITEYRDRWRDRIKEVHDTTMVVRVDSVAVDRVSEVKIEKPLPIGKKIKIRAFLPLLAVALIGWRREIYALLKKTILK